MVTKTIIGHKDLTESFLGPSAKVKQFKRRVKELTGTKKYAHEKYTGNPSKKTVTDWSSKLQKNNILGVGSGVSSSLERTTNDYASQIVTKNNSIMNSQIRAQSQLALT